MKILPIKKLVCPTDFSEPSYVGLNAAIELAEHFQAEIVLLNVISPIPIISSANDPVGYHLPAIMDQMRTAAEAKLKELISENVPETIRARSIVIQGRPHVEIVRLSDKEIADMIVIATHGESGWHKFVFGSVTEKVVRMASCSVLTIKEPKEK